MLKFEERTIQKITIPGKPIPTDFKIFALGDSDYIYNWKCIRPDLTKGLKEKKTRISIFIPNSDLFTFLNPTQSVVICLIKCLFIYIQKGLSFYLFLDNLAWLPGGDERTIQQLMHLAPNPPPALA